MNISPRPPVTAKEYMVLRSRCTSESDAKKVQHVNRRSRSLHLEDMALRGSLTWRKTWMQRNVRHDVHGHDWCCVLVDGRNQIYNLLEARTAGLSFGYPSESWILIWPFIPGTKSIVHWLNCVRKCGPILVVWWCSWWWSSCWDVSACTVCKRKGERGWMYNCRRWMLVPK